MKHIIITITLALATFTSCACDKKSAEKYICEKYGYVSTEIVDWGKEDVFECPYDWMIATNYFLASNNIYVLTTMNNAFHTSSKNEAIKILTECQDSILTFKSQIHLDERIAKMCAIVDHPDWFIGIPIDDDSIFNNYTARTISFTTPEGYVKKDVLIYDDQGRISCLASHLKQYAFELIDAEYTLDTTMKELEQDIRDWKKGYYKVF